MKILYIQCGLGNQMFQYAYLKYLESRGVRNIRIDASAPSLRKHAGFELRRVFPAIDAQRERFLSYGAGRTLHLLGDVMKKGFRCSLETEGEGEDRTVIPWGKVWLRGYWQEARFAEAVRDELLEDFRFREFTDEANREIAEEIVSCPSVGIHLRGGDYRMPAIRPVFGDICTPEYYREAIRYVRERVPGARLFVFTNGPEWAARNYDLEDAVFVNGNMGAESYRDMQLMSLCRHNIIPNSSFSCCGAWLNRNPEKIVVCPAKWFHNYPAEFTDGIVPAGWHRIGRPVPNVTLKAGFEIEEADLRNVLGQQYADFELLAMDFPTMEDPRVKKMEGTEAAGNHVLEMKPEELPRFADRKYLEKKLIAYFENQLINHQPELIL